VNPVTTGPGAAAWPAERVTALLAGTRVCLTWRGVVWVRTAGSVLYLRLTGLYWLLYLLYSSSRERSVARGSSRNARPGLKSSNVCAPADILDKGCGWLLLHLPRLNRRTISLDYCLLPVSTVYTTYEIYVLGDPSRLSRLSCTLHTRALRKVWSGAGTLLEVERLTAHLLVLSHAMY